MNILYIYHGDWPRNATRITKQTRTLAQRGHNVSLVAANPRAVPAREREPWMDVYRIPRLPLSLNRIAAVPLFFNPFWLGTVLQAARTCGADALVVRDLPLAPTAVVVGRLLGLPVHYDMADIYPVYLRANRREHPGLVDRVLRSPWVASHVEAWVLKRVTTVFVVSEESAARLHRLGVPPDRVELVGNTPANLEELAASYPLPADLAPWSGRRILLFIGNVLTDRGLYETIDALARIVPGHPNIGLAIIGDGPDCDRLIRRTAALGLEDHVRFLGWKPHHEHPAYYRNAHVGLIPFAATEHICITLSNKQFDYMAAGLPVVASDVPPARRIIDETRSGLVFPAGDADALARAIGHLLRDPACLAELGRNGRQAALHKYRWDRDGARFAAAIERAYRPLAPALPHLGN